MLSPENIDPVPSLLTPFEQRTDIRKNFLFFVKHVPAHLSRIFIEKTEHGERNVAVIAAERIGQFAADHRQTKIQEIGVRILQVPYERSDRQRSIGRSG